MRIAIYGGTFNPIHIGHTSLAEALIEQDLVDEVWMMVSPQNPHKDNNAAEYADRIAMAELAIQQISGVKICDFEHHLPSPSYTHTTLTELSKAYPNHHFTLVIGADNWKNFTRWYRAADIMQSYPILIYNRPDCEISLEGIPLDASIRVVDTPLYNISSTEIRNHKKLNMISPDVFSYIKAHHLYGF